MSQPPPLVKEACPLCGTSLAARQDWCLRCGAAARTRLAPPANWRGPLIILAIVMVLSLAVLGAALVKLSGKSKGSTTATTVQGAITTTAPATQATTAPTPTTTTGTFAAPSTITPRSSTSPLNPATTTVKP
ncbi:MAG TPA: hypothetical protein VGF15_01630 [Solirubrobacteraceae bacterium]